MKVLIIVLIKIVIALGVCCYLAVSTKLFRSMRIAVRVQLYVFQR